jgi:RNA polymerase sigma-70 factor (ECF subfamily)
MTGHFPRVTVCPSIQVRGRSLGDRIACWGRAVPAMRADPTAEFLGLLRDASDRLLLHFEARPSIRDDAAEVLAETLRQAWRHARDLPTEPERRRMWLLTVAANVLAERQQSTRRGRSRVHRFAPTQSVSSDPDQTRGSAVRDALRLHAAQRELVILVQSEGFSIVEAAVILGMDPATAGGSYPAAREHLRQALVSTAWV